MSICKNCRYYVDDPVWCLQFSGSVFRLWVQQVERLKENGFTECALYKAPANIQQQVQSDSPDTAHSLT
jgi:hypothetical protein